MLKQVRAFPPRLKERAYPKQVTQEGDAERYGGVKFQIDETIFAAYDKAEMRKAKVLVIASSDFVNNSLLCPDVIMFAGNGLDWIQSISMTIGVQRQTEMFPVTIVFTGINDHLHSRDFLRRLRDPATAEVAVWPAIKDVLESIGKIMEGLNEGGSKNIELPAVWSDISNAMRELKDLSLHMIVSDDMLGLELSNFSNYLKMKPGFDDDYQVTVEMSNDMWFKGI